ncbi:NADP-specific glutamate dehydrogenase [Trichinella spiralis]|uniref:NADP-specific glutamate dehydrogenase n=1 Tax=Trichinella spiralis TaxID=6334 RepID=A0ABR3KD90_TRISP
MQVLFLQITQSTTGVDINWNTQTIRARTNGFGMLYFFTFFEIPFEQTNKPDPHLLIISSLPVCRLKFRRLLERKKNNTAIFVLLFCLF